LFRVQASVLSNGGILVIAQPVANEANTLHRLVAVELTVTAAAMAVALLVGSFLVRAGLAPLTDMEHTARSIAEGLTVAEGGGAVVSSDESHDIDEESTDDLQSTDPDDSGTDGWSDEKPRASGPTLDDDLVTIELLSQRVPGANDRTEVGRLATTLNVMLDRIEAAFVARVDSERKLIASEEQLRRFVADASHELRTPIAAISAYAELFERGAKGRPEDLERLLSGVRSEAARMGRLVADLLLLARLDDGEERGADLVDLAVLVGDAVSTATVVGPEWPVVLFAGGSVEVIGDAGALRQVFDNLLANVRAHTPKGTTASVVVSSSMGVARVEVSDDGPGIPADRLAHVFDRFWRADPGRSRDKGGTGLGLAIVKSLVESQEGRVQVSSTFGAGTSFVVELPEAVII
jgi:signal transduction histidine kinase